MTRRAMRSERRRLASPESPDRTDGLPEEVFRVAGDDVVGELSDELVALPLIESARPRVEGGDAEEDVGRLAEDPFFGVAQEAAPDPAAPVPRRDADRLDVADEGSRHVQDQEREDALFVGGQKDLAQGIPQERQALLESATEREPRLGFRHHPRAIPSLFRGAERADVETRLGHQVRRTSPMSSSGLPSESRKKAIQRSWSGIRAMKRGLVSNVTPRASRPS